MNRKAINTSAAMLQPGRQSSISPAAMPVGDMPMVLTLDQFGPNPDNPRTTPNPRFDEIKASIQARGLDSVPKVTRDPGSNSEQYIFSDGGNTRYRALRELWEETGDERFYRIQVIVKPWPGRLHCVIGHLAENEVRGELTFIEKARGVHSARTIYEETEGKKISLRTLSSKLSRDGLPVSYSSISRMEDALRHLDPYMPELLESGLGRPQILALLSLRGETSKVWNKYSSEKDEPGAEFNEVWAECARHHNSTEEWSLDAFRDDLIDLLLQSLSHPDLSYDVFLMEMMSEKDASSNAADIVPEPVASDNSVTLSPDDTPAPEPENEERPSHRREEQPDLYGGETILSGDIDETPPKPRKSSPDEEFLTEDTEDTDFISLISPDADDSESDAPLSLNKPTDPAEEIIIPDSDIDDLQHRVFCLAMSLTEKQGCQDEIIPDVDTSHSNGYQAAGEKCSPFTAFLLELAGCRPRQSPAVALEDLLIGGVAEENIPSLDDQDAMAVMQLIQVFRQLRALQRVSPLSVKDDEDDDFEV